MTDLWKPIIKKRITSNYCDIFFTVGIERKIDKYCNQYSDYNLIEYADRVLLEKNVTWQNVATQLYNLNNNTESIITRRFQLYIIKNLKNKLLNLETSESELYKRELVIYLLYSRIII